jgi:hypothetical protein
MKNIPLIDLGPFGAPRLMKNSLYIALGPSGARIAPDG